MKKISNFLVVFLLMCTFAVLSPNIASALKSYRTRLDTPIEGIDVSAWQGDIDWKAVKKAGYKFAMIRCGWSTGKDRDESDQKFIQNVKNAHEAGLKIGTYLYSYAESVEEAKEEAEHCLRLIEPFREKIEYPVVFDIEDDSEQWSIPRRTGYNKDVMTDMVEAFCDRIKSAGYHAAFYANPNWLRNYLHGEDLVKKYDLWLAHYGVESPSYPCAIWQHTNEGSVPGIVGNVDKDYAYCDYSA